MHTYAPHNKIIFGKPFRGNSQQDTCSIVCSLIRQKAIEQVQVDTQCSQPYESDYPMLVIAEQWMTVNKGVGVLSVWSLEGE